MSSLKSREHLSFEGAELGFEGLSSRETSNYINAYGTQPSCTEGYHLLPGK
jgi:hypothetical protein